VELGAAQGTTRGAVREAEEGGRKRGGRELLEKRRGRVRLYTWRRAGLADEVGFDTMP
jgi:hypothetical protein